MQHKDNLAQLKNIHTELYNELINREFIIDAQTNEVETVINRWEAKETDPAELSITILPTLNCNLRCWYCYEKHEPGTNLTPTAQQKIYKLIERATASEQLKHLQLDFFGGEPLLGFKKLALPILEYAREQCTLHGIYLTVHFTTNGVLLTDDIIKDLCRIKFDAPTSFQITLDGNQEQHDQTRITANGKPTYRTIITNICKALQAGMLINIRLNYTEKNVDTLTDIIQEFESLPDDQKQHIRFDFQQVWQDMTHEDARSRALEAIQHYKRKNLYVCMERNYKANRCYAEYENKLVVNYNGDLFKCTARDFKPELREGYLDEQGVPQWNSRYHRRMKLKNGNSFCHACSIFPICHCGCSQVPIEFEHVEGCILQKSEEAKTEIIVGRLKHLLEQLHTK